MAAGFAHNPRMSRSLHNPAVNIRCGIIITS
jgi:hypothetical protein